MSSIQEEYIIEQMERWFAGYKIKRASNHLSRVVIGTTSTLTSFKKFLGFKYAKQFEVSTIEVPFSEKLSFTQSIFGRKVAEFSINCAIDESRKTVYWKAFKVN